MIQCEVLEWCPDPLDMEIDGGHEINTYGQELIDSPITPLEQEQI
jgi:hypothetical protein